MGWLFEDPPKHATSKNRQAPRFAPRTTCACCGRPVRSSIGRVCSRPRCHRRFLRLRG